MVAEAALNLNLHFSIDKILFPFHILYVYIFYLVFPWFRLVRVHHILNKYSIRSISSTQLDIRTDWMLLLLLLTPPPLSSLYGLNTKLLLVIVDYGHHSAYGEFRLFCTSILSFESSAIFREIDRFSSQMTHIFSHLFVVIYFE